MLRSQYFIEPYSIWLLVTVLSFSLTDDECGREAQCAGVESTLTMFGRRFCCRDGNESSLTFTVDDLGETVCTCTFNDL